ncbi:MerR family transcriptional regulator [Limnochorda pilosa]|uniref:MerR family transcriptional regulator n=2 Tax=Limnochorda pilosa TaxID=1555112 RepID=A0A0K2SGS7_LIMPI|nr:MerR family transcriptional regulator [Limnochorda pilosa]
MYTIKKVAEMTGISGHTLRFYDKEGLFPYVARDQNNVRVFSDEDLEWVRTVKCLRDTGMPLAEAKEYVQLCLQGDATIPRRYEMLRKQLQKAEQHLVEIQDRMNTLKMKTEYYKGVLEGKRQDLWNPVHFTRADRKPQRKEKDPSSMPA